MKADLDENWKDEVVIPQEVWRRTAELLAGHPGEKKLRLVVRMKLGVYKKTFDS